MCGRQYRFIFSLKLICLFLAVRGGVENAYRPSQFSRKLFNQFENCLRTVIKTLEFYKMGTAWMAVSAQLSLHFPGYTFSRWKMCHLEKEKKTLNIYDTMQSIFMRFSPKWSQCVWPSNSCNNWLWKCRSRSKFTKNANFWYADISEKKKLPTSNLADGNRQSKIKTGIRIRHHYILPVIIRVTTRPV